MIRLFSAVRATFDTSRRETGGPPASAADHSNGILQALFANLDEVILVIEGDGGTIVQAGDASERVFGFPPAEMIGATTESLHIDTEHFSDFARRIDAIPDRNEAFIVEYPMRRRDGSHFPAEIRVSAVELPDTARNGVVAIIRELSEREKELRCLNRISQLIVEHGVRSDRLYRDVVNSIPAGFHYPDATHCRVILPSSEYRSAHFLETENKHVRELMVHGNAYGRLEVYVDTTHFAQNTPPFLREEDTLLDVIVERLGAAIEQRIDSEAVLESSRKLTAVFESALDAIALIDDDRRYIELNPAALELTGLSHEEARGRDIAEIMHGADPESLLARWRRFKEHRWSTGEFRLARSDGQIRTVEFYAVADVLPGVHLSINRDITERKEYEKQLKAAIDERESLIREIHHRVKNNLQLVSSMLNLQMQTLEGADRRVLDTARARVNALALAYEQLVRSDRVATTDLNSYLGPLTASLAELNTLVSINLNAPTLTMDVDRAIPIALIVNELITNSLEHGFHDNRSGSVSITVDAGADEEIVLVVEDNGCGFPASRSATDGTGLGLQLVHSFAEQLGGRITIEGDSGVRAELRIPR